MKRQVFASVWDAIEDSPEEAAVMKVRSAAMMDITARVKAWKVPQREAAKRLGVTQPRLNDLLRGRIDKFSIDALVKMADHAGFAPRIAMGAKRRAA
jgi:predicted XRE-type DNA-binding protein